MRRALQYSALTDFALALHCEEPTLSRGGHVHEGVVSAELGLGPYPSIAESLMVERDLVARRRRRGARSTSCTSPRASRSRRSTARSRSGVAATGEVTPHHLVLTDEAVRSLDTNRR